MKTIKLMAIAFLASPFLVNVYAQTINPQQYAILPRTEIQLESSKKKDGTYSIPYLTDDKNLKFTPNGEYLFISNAKEKEEGKLVIYNVANKSIKKIFKLPKIGAYFADKFAVNANNIYQVALMVGKSNILVLDNWLTAPDDIFMKKKGDGATLVNAKIEYGKFDFSADGKSLFIMEDASQPLKIADLASGKITSKPLPKDKMLTYENPFIGNDEALLYSQKEAQSAKKLAEIFNINTGQIVRSYDIAEFDDKSPKNYSYAPHLLYLQYADLILNLQTGEKQNNIKKIRTDLATAKDHSARIYPVLNKGFVVTHSYYSTSSVTAFKTGTTYNTTSSQSNLYFYDETATRQITPSFPAVNRERPWTDLSNLQISPNGKYIVFSHKDINNDNNSRWIIATL